MIVPFSPWFFLILFGYLILRQTTFHFLNRKNRQLERIDNLELECFPEWSDQERFKPWSELRKF